jgi:hypothetical protein
MAAPVIYRSSDTNAPELNGYAGSLVDVLRSCLVDGYGSTKATATITSSGVAPSDGDTVTIDGVTYTFKTTLTPTAGQVLIGGSAATSLTNLVQAITRNGQPGSNYAAGTLMPPGVTVSAVTTTVITLRAWVGGTGGNSIAISKSAATLTLSGSTLSGGTGTNSKASLGWGMPFSATGKAVFRAPAGVRHYLDVDDSAPNATALARNANLRAYEVMTAVGTGTGPFPTVAQQATCVWPKSSTSNGTAQTWLLIGDDRTFWLFNDVDTANPPVLSTHSWGTVGGFGEIYSYVSGDSYRTAIYYPNVTATSVSDALTGIASISNVTSVTAAGAAMPRTYLGTGGAIWVCNIYSLFFGSTGSSWLFPNPVDGGLYINTVDVIERGNLTTPTSATVFPIRGRLRGFFQQMHLATAMSDQDTFSGVGDFAGRTFMILKITSATGAHVVETTAWPYSS